MIMSAKDPRRFATKKQIAELMTAQYGRCHDCRTILIFGETEIHHLVPHSVGGPTETYNLVALCSSCHRGRHDVSLS